ncbi:Retrovirus-related Pol poly from transposon [Labeo rohita]|nr:Retrovirus-related Pol poly from transposon [Labeo rohita]
MAEVLNFIEQCENFLEIRPLPSLELIGTLSTVLKVPTQIWWKQRRLRLDFLSATGAVLEIAQGTYGLRSGKGYTYYPFLPSQVPAGSVTPSAQAHSLTAAKVNLYYALPPTGRLPELMSFTPEVPQWDSDNQDELLKLISAWPRTTSNILGKTSVVQHKITLTDDIPLKFRTYRVSPIKKQIIEQHVDQMLQDNIIEPSFSPWSSPVVLVPKPDGSYRFCVDY